MPEKTKRTSAPKRFLHMGSFALFEVGFIGRLVGVRVTLDFNVSLDGCATGVAQPNLAWLPLVITRVWVHCPRASNGLLPPRSFLRFFLFLPPSDNHSDSFQVAGRQPLPW